MKQTTKNILGIGAIVLLSSGVAGLTTYKLLQSNKAATETSFLLQRLQCRVDIRM